MLQNEINEIGQFIPLHYHYQMLSDNNRMSAFRTTIEKFVKPNHKVAELGSGSGVLSFFAAKQGARVWAVEFNPALIEASERFLRNNNMDDKVQIFHGNALSWLPPEPVDWVVCEMLHSALLREKQLQVISNFRNAHLKEFGKAPRIIPTATLLAAQPVNQNYNFQGYYAPVPLFQSPYFTSDDCISCSNPIVYKTIDYDSADFESIIGDLSFSFSENATVNALRFITKNIFSMDFITGQTTDWHNQYLVIPLSETITVKSYEILKVEFSYQPGDPLEVLTNSIRFKVIEKEEASSINLEEFPSSKPEEIEVIKINTKPNKPQY
jgi:predicted RNA methylase